MVRKGHVIEVMHETRVTLVRPAFTTFNLDQAKCARPKGLIFAEDRDKGMFLVQIFSSIILVNVTEDLLLGYFAASLAVTLLSFI